MLLHLTLYEAIMTGYDFVHDGDYPMRDRRLICLIAATWFAALAPLVVADAGTISRAGFSFSDELGGFKLIDVTGRGSRDDPFILTETMEDIGPGVLVIRWMSASLARPWAKGTLGVSLYLDIRLLNASGRSWSGFELELQEIRHQPSVYGDGLSFDQGRRVPEGIGSDRFARFERMLEPHDRIQFLAGGVDHGTEVRFTANITDPTPALVFYLVQEPKLHFAAQSGMSADFAATTLGAASVPLSANHRRAGPSAAAPYAPLGGFARRECHQPYRHHGRAAATWFAALSSR